MKVINKVVAQKQFSLVKRKRLYKLEKSQGCSIRTLIESIKWNPIPDFTNPLHLAGSDQCSEPISD